MHRDTSTFIKAAFATVLGILSFPLAVSTEARAQVDQPFPPYNPYPPLPGSVPPTVLPPDLQSELLRVRREVQTIFGRYFGEWQALTPIPTYAGNPPILVPNGYQAQRILGGLLNFDESISPFQNIACASCHMPYTAFSGPIPSVNLGNFLRSGPQSFPDPNQPDWLSLAPTVDGQQQVMTARDVALTPPQCPTTEAGQVGPNGPIPYFQKEFFHNGYIKSLKQLVHFYNTRDSVPNPNGNTTYAFPVTSGHCPAGTVERVTCWPQPEVLNNIDMTTGALGLTDQEENQIVVFMQTLTDGFDPANPTVSTYRNIDTFTGQCPIAPPGVTASNQGNETLTPVWNLTQFPCATDICGVPPVPSPPIP